MRSCLWIPVKQNSLNAESEDSTKKCTVISGLNSQRGIFIDCQSCRFLLAKQNISTFPRKSWPVLIWFMLAVWGKSLGLSAVSSDTDEKCLVERISISRQTQGDSSFTRCSLSNIELQTGALNVSSALSSALATSKTFLSPHLPARRTQLPVGRAELHSQKQMETDSKAEVRPWSDQP